MNAEIVRAVVRHLLGAAGSVAASNGLMSADDVQALVGAGATIAAIVWSIVEKKQSKPNVQPPPKA